MGFVGYDTCKKINGHQLKVAQIQIQQENIESQKVISMRHILRQQFVLIVPHISTLLISCQKMYFHAVCKNIHKKIRGRY